MKMTSEIVKKWLDYRIALYEAEKKHSMLAWGDFDSERGQWSSEIQEAGLTFTRNRIQLFINQYATRTRKDIFKEIAVLAGSISMDDEYKGYKVFRYKKYEFFTNIDYDTEMIKERKKLGLEV